MDCTFFLPIAANLTWISLLLWKLALAHVFWGQTHFASIALSHTRLPVLRLHFSYVPWTKGHSLLWLIFLPSWSVLGPRTSPDLLFSAVKNKTKQEYGQPLKDHCGLKNLIFLCFLTMSSGVSPICKIINFLYLLFLMNLYIQLSFYLISHGFATLTKTF